AIGTACGPDRRRPRGGGPDRRVRRLRQAGGRRPAAGLRPARHRGHRRPGDRRRQRRRPAGPARPAPPPGRPLAAPARQRGARPGPRPPGVRAAARHRSGAGGAHAAGHLAAHLPGRHQRRQPHPSRPVLLPRRL
ncbi:MAG: Uncharacterized protein SCO1141, partial [uncultured Blastococcus sp.]